MGERGAGERGRTVWGRGSTQCRPRVATSACPRNAREHLCANTGAVSESPSTNVHTDTLTDHTNQ